MATNYPGSLDNFTNPTSASPINSPSHADQHSNANDAIEAIEGELGTNPKGAKATVKARLDDVDTAIATKAPIASPTFTGTVTIPAGSAITGVPYLATANTFTTTQTITPSSTSEKSLILSSASGTVNMQEWVANGGTAYIDNNGRAIFRSIGTNYQPPGGPNTMLYVNAIVATTSGQITRGAASQTASLQQWQNSSGTVFVQIGSGGDLFMSSATRAFFGGSDTAGYVNISTAGNGARQGIVIKGAASQTANLLEFQSSAGGLYSRFDSVGQYQGVYAVLSSDAVGTLPLKVKGASGQTANLTEWQNSSGSVLTKIDSSGALYLINPNPSANAGAITSPSINFQGSIWNNAYGSQTIKGAINVTEYLGNTNPTISKMAFLLATDNGTPAEVASFTNTGAFSNIGGLDAYGSNVIFRLRNTTDATTLAHTPSPKLELMGRAWNSSQGSAPTRAYLQVNANNINSDPFINRLGFFVATGNNAGGWTYGADATEYMSILGNGTVGINSTTPLATLDVRPTSASNKGIIIQGAASQTADLQQWQNSAGTVLTTIDSSGRFVIGRGTQLASATLTIQGNTSTYSPDNTSALANRIIFLRGNTGGNLMALSSKGDTAQGVAALVITNGGFSTEITGFGYNGNIYTNIQSASTVGLTVKGAASQTANLQEWQNSAGTVIANIYSNGTAGLYGLEVFTGGAQVTGNYANTDTLQVNINGAARRGILVKGAASQSANLQEWQDSTGAVNAFINSSMQFAANRITAGSTTVQTSARLSSVGGITTDVMLGLRGAASATGDYVRMFTSAGVVMGGYNALAQSFTGSTAPILKATGGATTAASGDGTTATVTTTSAHGLAVGDLITIAGITPSGYNATAILTAVTSTTISYLNATTGAQTVAGTVSAPAQASATTRSAGTVGLIVRASASQTVNLLEWQNSSGTLLGRVDNGGGVQSNYLYAGTYSYYNSQLNVTSIAASNIGAVVRGAASQTANLQEWQNSAGTVLSFVGANGNFVFPYFQADGWYDRNNTTPYLTMSSNKLVANSRNASYVGFIVQGVASQTAALQEWQDSSGTMLASITDTGFSTAILRIPYIYSYAIQGWNGVGGSIEFANATPITIKPQSASVVNLVIKGAVSQSADLQQWQDSSGTALAGIGPNGRIYAQGKAGNTDDLLYLRRADNNIYMYVDKDATLRGNFSIALNQNPPIDTQAFMWSGTTSRSALGVSGTGSTNPTFYAKATASQTSNLTEWQDSNGTVLTAITQSGAIKSNISSTISANTATTVDTVALSSFTTIEYTLSIKQGSKIRSSKVLVHTDGTSVDSTEYGIIEMGGGITGIIVAASVSSTNSILQVTITDAATTNATVKLIKTML